MKSAIIVIGGAVAAGAAIMAAAGPEIRRYLKIRAM
jgi:hypothetical protein